MNSITVQAIPQVKQVKAAVPAINQKVQRVIDKGIERYRNSLRSGLNYYDNSAPTNLIDAHQTNLKSLVNCKDLNPNEYAYVHAFDDMSKFVDENLRAADERNIARQAIFSRVYSDLKKENDIIRTLPLRDTTKKAEEIFELDLKMDKIENDINAIFDEARANKQVKLTPQQKTKYNKLATQFNKCVRMKKYKTDMFYLMKTVNLQTGMEAGIGEFFKQYAYYPFRIKAGNKKFVFNGNLIWMNKNRDLKVIDNPEATQRLIVDGDFNIRSKRTVDSKGVYTTEVYNSDGDVVQISKYDSFTHKNKIIQKKK